MHACTFVKVHADTLTVLESVFYKLHKKICIDYFRSKHFRLKVKH